MGTLSQAAVVVLLVGAVLCWPRGPATACPPMVRSAWWRAPPALVRWHWRRWRPAPMTGVLPVLDTLAAALSCGLAPGEAVRHAAVDADPRLRRDVLEPVLAACARGQRAGPAWERLARAPGTADPDLAALGRAWTISERLGSPLAAAVATTGATARSRAHLLGRLRSETAGARATVGLLTALPVAGLVLAWLTGVPVLPVLSSPIGAGSVGLGALLAIGGRAVVHRMVRGLARGVGEA